MKNRALTIANTPINQDENGLFSLNDLHKAAGGEKRHQPSDWLRLQQTQDLIAELGKVKPGIPGLTIIRGGKAPGTFVVKELVYAYAMWISPTFHIKVIRAYDSLMHDHYDQPATPKSIPLEQLLKVSDKVVLLTQKAVNDTDPFSRQQTLRMLKNVCEASGVEFADPALLGTRVANDHPTLVKFWDIFESLNHEPEQPFNHSISRDEEIAINLAQLYRHCESHGITLPERKYLIRLMYKSQRYPFLFNTSIRSRLINKTVRCFVFKNTRN